MRKCLRGIALGVLGVLLSCTVVLAVATYACIVAVTNSSSTSYSMLGVSVSTNNTQLADDGYITTAGTDVQVLLNGSSTPRMLASDRTNFAMPLAATSAANVNYTTGNSPSDFAIVPGYSGYMTVADADNLEPGGSFSFDLEGFIDTSSGGSLYPNVVGSNSSIEDSVGTSHTVYLPDSISSGDLLLVLFASFSTTGTPTITWPAGWTNLSKSGTSYRSAGTAYRIAGSSENSTITVTTAVNAWSAHQTYSITDFSGVPEVEALNSGVTATPDADPLIPSWGAKYSLWFTFFGGGTTALRTLSSYPSGWSDGEYTHTTSGPYYAMMGSARLNYSTEDATSSCDPGAFTMSDTVGCWSFTIGVRGSLDKFELNKAGAFSIYNSASGQISATVHSSTPKTVSWNMSSAAHHVRVSTDGSGNLVLYVDNMATPVDSEPLGGMTVPSKSSEWIIGESNTTPYLTYFSENTSGTCRMLYQPSTIIQDEVLPDISGDGTNNPGTITWGSNPSGVTASVGPMSYSGEAATSTPAPTNPQVIQGVTSAPATAPAGVNTNFPLYGMFHMVATILGVTDVVMINIGMIFLMTAFGIVCLMTRLGPVFTGIIEMTLFVIAQVLYVYDFWMVFIAVSFIIMSWMLPRQTAVL